MKYLFPHRKASSTRDLHGPGPGPCPQASVRPGPRVGSGMITPIMFRSGPGSNISNQALYRTFRAFCGQPSFFAKKVIRRCSHLMLVTQLGSGDKPHRLDVLGDFRSCPLQEIFRDDALKTWHPIS
jgi:hypothetical protein